MSSEIIYGIHPAREMLLNARGRIIRVILICGKLGPKLKDIQRLAEGIGVSTERKSRGELDLLAGGGRHQGVVVVAEARRTATLRELLDGLKGQESPVILVLDGITDPRNLGAIIRAAEVFGGVGVVIGKDRSAGLNPAAVKVSAGAAEILPVVTAVNIVQSLKLLKENGFWVVGTAIDGEKNCFQYDWAGPTVVVLGSEERGLRRLVRESCDVVVSIPFKGKITSLNVASAAAVIMYEILRQKEKDIK